MVGVPTFDMFRLGRNGVPLDECVAKAARNGIMLRQKDIRSYNDGAWKGGIDTVMCNGIVMSTKQYVPPEEFKDFPKIPIGWKAPENRFFPCTEDNRPMQKWGWAKDENGSVVAPELYTYAEAKALSPCGWVGQNMLYQRFIVMDIDGRGHGKDDISVIAFGRKYSRKTMTMEDPAKPGSFHLYFKTDRLIPVRHFTWAKLDLMGNAVNAAVYLKNKQTNGLPMLELTEEIWEDMMTYQRKRKESNNGS